MENFDRLLKDLSDIPLTTEPALVRQKSRDFFWYSPVLNQQLRGCAGQAVVSPGNQAEVIRVAAACYRHNVPLTARGGGTGNYGQAVPLHGGVVLDMTALDTIEWQDPVCCGSDPAAR
jgi:FAD/FMN-containing dehydrogenase